MPELLLDHGRQEQAHGLIELSSSLPTNTIAHINEAAIQPGAGEEIIVDLARFSAVKAHSGDMGTLLKEAEINGRPIGCPFLQSLGAKGIELAQKWVAEDKNPHKNLSLDELIAQKKVGEQTAKPVAQSDHDTKIKSQPVSVPKHVPALQDTQVTPSALVTNREFVPDHKSVLPAVIQNQAQQAVRLAIEQQTEPHQLISKLKPATLPKTYPVAPIIFEAAEAKPESVINRAKISQVNPPVQVQQTYTAKSRLVDTALEPQIEPKHEVAIAAKTEPALAGSATLTRTERHTATLTPTHANIETTALPRPSLINKKPALTIRPVPVKHASETASYSDESDLVGFMDTHHINNALDFSSDVETTITAAATELDFALWENEFSGTVVEAREIEQDYTYSEEGVESTQASIYTTEFDDSFTALAEDAEINFTTNTHQAATEDLFLQLADPDLHVAIEQPELTELETLATDETINSAVNLTDILVKSFESSAEVETKIGSLERPQAQVTSELFREIVISIVTSLGQPVIHAEKQDDELELQQKCNELFTLIGLNYDDETVTRFVQNIRETMLTNDGAASSSLLELSQIGTHEYKFRHKLSPLRLIQIIKRSLQQQLRVGQYVLRVS